TAPAAPTISCVLPMPLNESPTAFGLTVIVVFRVPVHPKLSVTVIATAPFSTVLVGVPDTTPVADAIERPVGSPVALHVKLDPVLPVCVNVTGPYAVWKRPSGIAVDGFTVIAGQTTLRVKFCVASGGTLLLAVNVSGNAPVCVGVPASTRVADVHASPVGSVPPVCVIVGAGKPLAVTVNGVAAVPTVNVVLLALVNSGGWLTVSVKFCVTAGPPTPLLNVNVIA